MIMAKKTCPHKNEQLYSQLGTDEVIRVCEDCETQLPCCLSFEDVSRFPKWEESKYVLNKR